MSSPSCLTSSPREVESGLADLQYRYDQMVASNKATVSRLQAEVLTLQEHVRQQAEELALLRRCRSGTAGSVSELLKQLRTEHEALLQRQLDDIRSECLRTSHALNSDTLSRPANSTQSQPPDGNELTGSSVCVTVSNDGQTEVVPETSECCDTAVSCPLTTQSDNSCDLAVPSQKRQLSPSFDFHCTSADGFLAKNTKLF